VRFRHLPLHGQEPHAAIPGSVARTARSARTTRELEAWPDLVAASGLLALPGFELLVVRAGIDPIP
jgi:hypothetical protein